MILEIAGIGLGLLSAISALWYLKERLHPFHRISWRIAQRMAASIANSMSRDGYSPTLIFGIGRGGAIMGSLISGVLGHRPLCVVDRQYTWIEGRRVDDVLMHISIPPQRLERVLLIAGEVHSGNTMHLYWKTLKRIGAKEIRRATLFYEKGSPEPVEYIGIKSNRDLRLPWMFSKNYDRQDRRCDGKESHQRLSPHGKSCNVFIVRHAESIDNSDSDKFSGISDPGLTEKGSQQTNKLAQYMRNVGIERIYTSPMRRTIQTARRIQEETGSIIASDPRLREMDFGDWEGLSKQEVSRKWTGIFEAWKDDPVSVTPPGGEKVSEVLSRITAFWDNLICTMASDNYSNVLIVTHKSVGRMLICKLKRIPIVGYREMSAPNCQIWRISLNQNGNINVQEVNIRS